LTRYLFTLRSPRDRDNAIKAVCAAPAGARVEVKAEKRSLDQNKMMWALLSDVAMQKDHCGRRYTPDQWKCIFMHACGQEVTFIPSLDGTTFIPWGQRSSDLSKDEMTNLIECILAWGAQNGVQFHNDETEAA
jgi:hypothetical protein